MKTLKFAPELVDLVKNGSKTSTWRLFDDKNIQTGDFLTLIKRPEIVPFAEAQVIAVTEKALKDINEEDKKGHETVGNSEQMYETYSKYYNQQVTPETIVKIIKFNVTKFL